VGRSRRGRLLSPSRDARPPDPVRQARHGALRPRARRLLAREQPGDHSLRFAGSGDTDALFDEIEDFLTDAPHAPVHDRVLATILLAQTVSSDTAAALAIGRHRIGQPHPSWSLSGQHQAPRGLSGQQVQSHRGRVIKEHRRGYPRHLRCPWTGDPLRRCPAGRRRSPRDPDPRRRPHRGARADRR
jgi:hypothetical protein